MYKSFACIWWDKSEASAIIVAKKIDKNKIEILDLYSSGNFFNWIDKLSEFVKVHEVQKAIFEYDDTVEKPSQNTMGVLARERVPGLNWVEGRRGSMGQFAARSMIERVDIDGSHCPGWQKGFEKMLRGWESGEAAPMGLCLGMIIDEAWRGDKEWLGKL